MSMELKYPMCQIQTDQAGTLEFSISMCRETMVSRCGLSMEDIEQFLTDLQNEIYNFKQVLELRDSSRTQTPAPSARGEIKDEM